MKGSAPSGTTSTAVENLSIVSIIETCAKSGVSRLKLGDIEICFKDETNHKTVSVNPGLSATASLPNPQVLSEESLESTPRDLRETSIPYDRELQENLRVNQLMIDDPFGFEREIINSHLKRDQGREAI